MITFDFLLRASSVLYINCWFSVIHIIEPAVNMQALDTQSRKSNVSMVFTYAIYRSYYVLYTFNFPNMTRHD